MDDLGKMLGSVGGATGGGGTAGGNDIAGAIGGLVGSEGGLEGLLGQLSSAGLGDQVQSWVGTGPNQPVDPDQLGSALGPERVNQLSSQTGIDVGSLLPMLASALPAIINALTPDGKVPSGGATGGFNIGSVLQGLGGGGANQSPAVGGVAGVPDIGSILGGKD
jgi:uncharacterized protein YidB (DUF937 family)